MAEQFENNYTTQLNGAIDDNDTTLTVDAAPTTMTGEFRIRIEDEIILVGAVSGLTFTGCTRGAEGTTAAAHADNAVVRHVLTAGAISNIETTFAPEVAQLGKNAIGGSTGAATNNRIYLKKITPSKDGLLTSIGIYVKLNSEGTNPAFRFMVWDDVSGDPRHLIGFSGVRDQDVLLDRINGAGGLDARWIHGPIGIEVTAGTSYWIGWGYASSGNFIDHYYDSGSGSDRYMTATTPWQDAGWTTPTTTTDDYSIRATIIQASEGVSDTKYNPDHETPATTPSVAAEFNGALDTNWTWDLAPTGAPDYTTYPGYMNIEHTAATGGRLSRAFAPGSNATLAGKLSMSMANTGTTRAYIFGFSDTNSSVPTNFNGIYIIQYSGVFKIANITRTGGNWTVGTEQPFLTTTSSPQVYYRMTYESGVGTVYVSLDGMSWTPGTTASRSVTISHLLVLVDAQHAFNATWDWIRGWNSVVEKVGA
jgi:hypothetical protein